MRSRDRVTLFSTASRNAWTLLSLRPAEVRRLVVRRDPLEDRPLVVEDARRVVDDLRDPPDLLLVDRRVPEDLPDRPRPLEPDLLFPFAI